MDIKIEYPDAFSQLGAIFRAWAAATTAISEENILGQEVNTKEFVSQLNRLEDSETMAAFGYVARAEAHSGINAIMQADIVNALAPDCEQEKQKVRQDIKRRMDALAFFGLIERKYLTQTALQLILTEYGRECQQLFNKLYTEETLKMKGVETCSDV